MCLKRKKTYEAQIEKLAGARMTIETQVMTLEGANVNLDALTAMKMGATAMKSIHKDMYKSFFCSQLTRLSGMSIKWMIRWMKFVNKWTLLMKFQMP